MEQECTAKSENMRGVKKKWVLFRDLDLFDAVSCKQVQVFGLNLQI